MIKKRNDLPKASIITPSLNQAEYIERTIKSVLSQDYPNLEYIIMDGGSTDGTVEILKKYDKQSLLLRNKKFIWRSGKDKGQVDAINKGLKLAKGEILCYLNSDDTLEPNSIKQVVDYFKGNPKSIWVIGKCRIIDKKDREIRKEITAYKNFWLGHYNRNTLLILNYINQPAVFWRREVYEKIGKLNTKYFWALDYDYWLRISDKYQPGFIDQYLANFRVHRLSKTSIGIKNFLEEVEVAKKYTNNPILIGLHYLNLSSIAIGYSILSRL